MVFSGRRGFHVHALDFDLRDWTHYNPRRPIKSHEVARLKFSRLLAQQIDAFDRPHFILSVDPMRVMSVPHTLNAETGLICLYVGDRKDLEACSTRSIVGRSNPALQVYGYPEPVRAVKHCAALKTEGEKTERVTSMTSPSKNFD